MSRTTLVGCSAALILAGLLPLVLSQPQARRSGFLNGHHVSDDFPAEWVVPPQKSGEVCNHAVPVSIPNPGFINLTESTCPAFGTITGQPTFHVYGTHNYTAQLKMFLTNDCDPLLRHTIVHNFGSTGRDMNFVTRDGLGSPSKLTDGLGKICDSSCEALALYASGGENEKVVAFRPSQPFWEINNAYNVSEEKGGLSNGIYHIGLVGRECCHNWTLVIHDDSNLENKEFFFETTGEVLKSGGSFLHWSLHLPGCSVCDTNSSCPPKMVVLPDGLSFPNPCYTAQCVPPNCKYNIVNFTKNDPEYELCGEITCDDCGEILFDDPKDCRQTDCTTLAQQNLTTTIEDEDPCTSLMCVPNTDKQWVCKNIDISSLPSAPKKCQPPLE